MRECCGKPMQAEIVRPGLIRYRCLDCDRAIFRARRTIGAPDSMRRPPDAAAEKDDPKR